MEIHGATVPIIWVELQGRMGNWVIRIHRGAVSRGRTVFISIMIIVSAILSVSGGGGGGYYVLVFFKHSDIL